MKLKEHLQDSSEELQSDGEKFVVELEAFPGVESRRLIPGDKATVLPMDSDGVKQRTRHLDAIERKDHGVDQELYAVVKADREIFGIVGVEMKVPSTSGAGHETKEALAITRVSPSGGRAELVGFATVNQPFMVGRDYQPGLNNGTSRRHFAVGLAENGSIGVVDWGSTNGTELITPGENYTPLIDGNGDAHGPAGDFGLWSVKSVEMRWALEDAR